MIAQTEMQPQSASFAEVPLAIKYSGFSSLFSAEVAPTKLEVNFPFWVNNSWGFRLKYLSRCSHKRWNFITLWQVFFCLYVKYGLTESQEQRKHNLVDVFLPLIESTASDVTVIHLPALTPSAYCVQVLKNRNRQSSIDSLGISLQEPRFSSPSPSGEGRSQVS